MQVDVVGYTGMKIEIANVAEFFMKEAVGSFCDDDYRTLKK